MAQRTAAFVVRVVDLNSGGLVVDEQVGAPTGLGDVPAVAVVMAAESSVAVLGAGV